MPVLITLPFNLTNGTFADATQVMANYNAVTGGLASGAAASGINNDITSLIGLTTPLAPIGGGTPIFVGGFSTGTAAAQIVNPTTPNSFTLAAGNIVLFNVGFTSTGPTTIAVNGTPATPLFKQTPGGLAALVASDILLGSYVMAVFDGARFQLLSSRSGTIP